MSNRLLCYLEWVVIDACNFSCHYCVNKGEYSHKSKKDRVYTPGIEKQIAEKILRISKSYKKVVVNLTGGEPTIARYIRDVLLILNQAPNIDTRLITNLKSVGDLEESLPMLSSILVSTHVSYRSDKDIDEMINLINRMKKKVNINIAQVDFELTDENMRKLLRLKKETGLPIDFQTFIPPWTEKGRMLDGKKISDTSFQSSFGKRCVLGYFCFLISPNGIIDYDLWCIDRTNNRVNFLSEEFDDDLDKITNKDMKKCPNTSCGCNYNCFIRSTYLKECLLKGYPIKEIFLWNNVKFHQIILRKMTALKMSFSGRN